MKLRDSQEVSEKDESEIVVGTNNATHFFKVKNALNQQIKAVEKMYQAASMPLHNVFFHPLPPPLPPYPPPFL